MIFPRAIVVFCTLLVGCSDSPSPVEVCNQVLEFGIDVFSKVEKGNMEYFESELEKIEGLHSAYRDCGNYFDSIPNFKMRLFMAETNMIFLVDDYRAKLKSGDEIEAKYSTKLMGEKIKNISVWAKYQLAEID